MFTKKEANEAQTYDLLNFRIIGQCEFLQRIAAVILKQPSVKAPNRKRRLQTLSEKNNKVTCHKIGKRQKINNYSNEKKNAVFMQNRNTD